MEKRKKWQLYLIVATIALTLYNILPTLFYYGKPLKTPIDAQRALPIAERMIERVNSLEKQSEEWLYSFCNLIGISPQSVSLDPNQPEFFTLNFKSIDDAKKFRTFLPRAGALISFVPEQLSLYDSEDSANKAVIVQRRIPLRFDTKELKNYVQFSEKFDAEGNPTALYRGLIDDRALQVGISLAGPTENAQHLQGLSRELSEGQTQEILLNLSQDIIAFTKVYPETSSVAKRYFASFSQIETADKQALIQNFIRSLELLGDKVKAEKTTLKQESDALKSQGQFLEVVKQQRLEILSSREKTLNLATAIVKRNSSVFASGADPLSFSSLGADLQQSAGMKAQTISLKGRNPFIDALTLDWNNETIYLTMNPDAQAVRRELDNNPAQSYQRDLADQLLYNAIAFASRRSGEEITPFQDKFAISLSSLTNSKSFLALRLSTIAAAEAKQLVSILQSTWHPSHPDLKSDAFPIYDYETFSRLPAEEQKLGLVVYAPSLSGKIPPRGFQMHSIYVVAKGMDRILERLKNDPNSPNSAEFSKDFNRLRTILQSHGFIGYSGAGHTFGPEYSSDFIFEGEDYYQTVLKATREEFSVHGTKRYGVLEFTDVEQRVLTENRIDDQIHEDLLKWRDDYHAAQLSIKGVSKYDVPKPTRNVYWDNLKLSCVKYFRGDDRKILHWGLDLSGGKTVQLELRDTNNRVVTNETDIKQGINELYSRVNKMGVSEVSIRQEGNTITLDFPGSQGMSAAELVKASTMYFHIANEKFGMYNPALSDVTNRFLQEIWNEAAVTGRKTSDEIQLIAWKHLHGDSLDPDVIQPRSEAARILYENGLRLSDPRDPVTSSAFNETTSKIALYRGDDFTDWYGQTHPLLIVFRNYALEGANLDNVHSSYDPSKGNFLSFSVKGSYTDRSGQKIEPREDLYAWSSQFAKEKIAGSPAEIVSGGKGWRMAVILNGYVISAPTLDAALKDGGMISGSFTQREINQLEADLKAGSLSFTPHILSEKNVSPELGASERMHGIIATILSLALVIIAMVCYYRFGGAVASIAVILNLFIMWATLQNLQATMTLAGIAGIILTLGMAVDANVLVFERIREEFAISGRIASAVNAGYRKAFSAILDSNVTTIIAALILLQFDSGPIKAFAITMIIGIVSSMFTALFMTRYFFAGWVLNPEHKSLNMLNWFKAKSFNFLKYAKVTFVISGIVILVGCFALVSQRHTLFGMDFKGGYALSVELTQSEKEDYRDAVESALVQAGAQHSEFQIRELSPSNHIRIFLSRSLEQPGRPFFGMPLDNDLKEPVYPYENNPRIVWVTHALSSAHLDLSPGSLMSLDQNWTSVSGQMSDTMRNNAIIGLVIAMLCILVYITVRFEFKYAISATLCMAHDVIFTVGIIALLHAIGVPLQIDLNAVVALMTIVGYSLNDTIIVFDRIREDVRIMRKSSLTDIINHALNITLSRTVMTSGTTLLVLIPLILLGGSTLFGFALIMAIGVVFGTLSSLFIAAPLMKYFHDRELQKEEKFAVGER
ncbi:MAG: protein translocase subunit SecD [Verrucomicrobia bacterium]|nr:protein translocase subunit SecD [Verrucomicrobiota bacterium]